MRILTYKRTHTGDPDTEGRFGINDCMGRIRNFPFDAVIGVGGTGWEPRSFGIDRKINWVGVGPKRERGGKNDRGSIVTFERFVLFEERGPLFHDLAPALAKRMYAGGRFVFKSYSEQEKAEAISILELAAIAPEKLTTVQSVAPRRVCKIRKCISLRRKKRCRKAQQFGLE